MEGKTNSLNKYKLADMANFIYIRQKGPYGNGTRRIGSDFGGVAEPAIEDGIVRG